MPGTGFEAPVEILDPSFEGVHLTKFYEKERKRKISTCAVFANTGQD